MRSVRADRLREWLAIAGVCAFVLTLGASFYAAGTGHWGNAREWLNLVLPLEGVLLLAAARFYFSPARQAGRRSRKRR